MNSPPVGPPERSATAIAVPPEVEAVFRAFRTAEFSTFARAGCPTVQVSALWQPTKGRFLVTTGIGFEQAKKLAERSNLDGV